MPSPSKSFLVASSRGERGGRSNEEPELGVEGDECEPDLEDDSVRLSSASASSIATVGSGCDVAAVKRNGCGRARTGLTSVVDTGDTRVSGGGGDTRTLGVRPGLTDTALFPLRTELLLPPRRQETAVSDLDGATELLGVPREVPPLAIVVEVKLPREAVA